MSINQKIEVLYQKLLSEKTKRASERIILVIAIASFVVHLVTIYLVDFGIVSVRQPSELLKSPIAAIYTPFSFILVYEVYLLVHYLSKSITVYISKQYEIISLIIIRRLFKDLSTLSLSSDWFSIKYDLQFTYDLLASILLFFLIYQFYVQSKKVYNTDKKEEAEMQSVIRFVKIKKMVATALVPLLICLAAYSFVNWCIGALDSGQDKIFFKNINNIFFDQFFTVLIIVDVILLLFSFFHTDQFHKVIRNSGFIISTILIRLSFSATGLISTLLVVAAIVFGLVILIIHNKFEKQIALDKRA